MERINAGLLIPGRGEPVRDQTVVVDKGAIVAVGPRASVTVPAGAQVIDGRGKTLVPGLWDCHGHFMCSRGLYLARLPQEPTPLRAARSARDLANALNAGITSVREVGGLGVYLAQAVREGLLDGPSIYAAGAVLSTTGGHGDLHCYPLSWMHDFGYYDGTFRLADGTSECMRAVREQLRRGAAVIKVCASGGVMSEVDHPVHQQFTDAELRAIVEVAGLADRVVAAHCHGKPESWLRCGPGSRTSHPAHSAATTPARPCARPGPSWSPPGRSSRTSWSTSIRSRRTRRPS
jgi:imidazolonepropionase-like amidohydrolase